MICPFNVTAESNILIPLNTHPNNHPLPIICPFNVTAESNIFLSFNTHPNNPSSNDLSLHDTAESNILIPLSTHPNNHPLPRSLRERGPRQAPRGCGRV